MARLIFLRAKTFFPLPDQNTQSTHVVAISGLKSAMYSVGVVLPRVQSLYRKYRLV